MSIASQQLEVELRPAGRTSTRMPVIAKSSQTIRIAKQSTTQRGFWKVAITLTMAVMTVAATTTYFNGWTTRGAKTMAGQIQPSPAPILVTVAQPLRATTTNIVLPATFRPWQTTTLNARVSGYLTGWHRDLGATVQAGDLLAEIQTPELDQELAENEALASEAAAVAIQVQAERVEAQAELEVAEAQLMRVRAEHQLAQSQMVRREKLLSSRAISKEEHDTFQRQLEVSAANVAAAQSDFARRRTNLDTRAAVIAARQATAKSRQANVDRLRELQAFKRIVAPFDGVITSRTAEVGMLITAGKEPLFVVEDLSRIRVRVQVPQTYAMQTSPGVAVSVRLPESAMPPVPGSITRIAESVDAASRTMLAEIELDNSELHFQPGSYAQVTLASPQNSTDWTIPTNAVSMRTNGPHVVLVNESGQIEIKRVTLGRDLGSRVIVADGIQGGERLVVNPGDDLTSGVQTQIRPQLDPATKVAQR